MIGNHQKDKPRQSHAPLPSVASNPSVDLTPTTVRNPLTFTSHPSQTRSSQNLLVLSKERDLAPLSEEHALDDLLVELTSG